MINLKLINFESINANEQEKIKQLIDNRLEYFNELFKRYPTDVTFEFKFQSKPSGWKVDALVKMQSTTLFFEESDKNLEKLLNKLLTKIKNQVKKQKAIERKDYEYKRAKYRKKKLSEQMFQELITYKSQNKRKEFDKTLEQVYADLLLDIIDNCLAKGKDQSEAQSIANSVLEKVKSDVFETFTASEDQREEFLDSISDITHYHEQNSM